eukprot:TRINITY_DN278_c0_g1_i35.p1 TRINITY_DN278_c0_g1~~TRINITY_DN278_c0_g1_i35.p1  ORF type:complete len:116 (+),score=28.54 TRINITY_DN278_c0_g1_i35:1-348(+)
MFSNYYITLLLLVFVFFMFSFYSLFFFFFFFLMIRRPPRSTLSSSSAASDVYKRQVQRHASHPRAPLERKKLCLGVTPPVLASSGGYEMMQLPTAAFTAPRTMRSPCGPPPPPLG